MKHFILQTSRSPSQLATKYHTCPCYSHSVDMPRPLYRRLNMEKREIRVLIVRSSRRKNSRVRCNLIHADLDALSEAPFHFYEAVSYTWGDMSDVKSIDLDGHSFSVTRNLHGLLKRLRHKRTPGFYWVDAICINQQDIPERNQQVQLMKAIYENAEQVLVWLGPASDDSDIAMQLIDEITDADSDYDATESESVILGRWSARLQASLRDPDDHYRWEAIARLFDRPWWRRAWIRQEVAVASNVWVLCGDDCLQRWATLIQAMEAINRVAADFEPFTKALGGQSSGYHQAIAVDVFRESISQQGCVKDEEYLLLHGRQCEATDPRDRVFALVGLAGEQARAALMPDYQLPVSVVFAMATKYLITSSNTLDALSHCGLGKTHDSMPSWVMDPRTDWSELPLRFREDQETLYITSLATAPTIEFGEQAGSETLVVEGVSISNVAHVSPGYLTERDEHFEMCGVTSGTTTELLDIWLAGSPASKDVHGVESQLQTWFRTIIADQDNVGSRATEQYIRESFPLSPEHIVRGCPDVPSIDQMCQTFCDSSPVYASHVLNRRMFITKGGMLGLGPRVLAIDDLVCLIYGCGVPLVLRPIRGDCYQLVGEAYVHAIMNGDAFSDTTQHERVSLTII
jgi:hypothetical protein